MVLLGPSGIWGSISFEAWTSTRAESLTVLAIPRGAAESRPASLSGHDVQARLAGTGRRLLRLWVLGVLVSAAELCRLAPRLRLRSVPQLRR